MSENSGGGEFIVAAPYLSYPGPDGEEITAGHGEPVSDLPEQSIGWLVEQGLIVPVHIDNQLAEMKTAARRESEESE